MGAIEDSRKPVKVLSARAAQLANSRTCYDHIAGRLGVELRKSLERQGVVELHGDRFLVTDSGWDSLAEYGIGKVDRRSLTKVCLDWTERTPHIGSWLGTALYKVFLERRWIAQGDTPRLLVVTPLGKECLMRCFGIAPR